MGERSRSSLAARADLGGLPNHPERPFQRLSHRPGSPAARGIPYDGKLLEASKGELKTPEFLAINPFGRVPAIRDGNFTLHESLAIMVYLDRKHPNPPLFGRPAEEAGRIFERISEFISDFWPPGQRLIRSIFFGPPLAAEEAKEVREKIHVGLARLEGYAEDGGWMAGRDLTAADTRRGYRLPYL
jgi:glutathione S-transferase